MIVLESLERQIEIVIPLLELQYQKTPIAILELLLKRYKKALSVIQKSDGVLNSTEQIIIYGGVRAYLDSASDLSLFASTVLKYSYI